MVLPSRTLASMAFRDQTKKDPKLLRKVGFWLCPLRYPVEPPPAEEPSPEARAVDAVFERLERACPRLFPPGESRSVRTPEGFRRIYPSADTRAYVLDDGQVWYKYWRALNADFLGQKQDVLGTGFKMDCNKVRGRSGLPWEREL